VGKEKTFAKVHLQFPPLHFAYSSHFSAELEDERFNILGLNETMKSAVSGVLLQMPAPY
jgi:hypothetical protein